MFLAEFLKLRRSATWIIAIPLPVLAVITGSVNFYANQQILDHAWASAISQMNLFYGIFFFGLGVALIVATSWRYEHQGSNFHHLQALSDSPLRLFLAKALAATSVVAFMQLVFVVSAYLSAHLVLGLEPTQVLAFLGVNFLVIPLSFSLVLFQGFLSMWFRSFSIPVGICLVLCFSALASLKSGIIGAIAGLFPQALVFSLLTFNSSAISSMEMSLASVLVHAFAVGFMETLIFLFISLALFQRTKR
ncbi:ABC transporter permease subunit [Corynebacterium poyangense]|uniref:ABC transporter permease subunit n=1 Tax=Corynebacterium poyangense TaxID=2684405 RepID=A0A7H0SPX6_9CORY|nr:ABC transporter permease [Corynebacterium poyangense]MBZ8178474.1 ABC transporter permease subunit [Corynebacterium poyangense]QNQ90601.1 ABC transporter permease subunit [Corynebacterium poyangense]